MRGAGDCYVAPRAGWGASLAGSGSLQCVGAAVEACARTRLHSPLTRREACVCIVPRWSSGGAISTPRPAAARPVSPAVEGTAERGTRVHSRARRGCLLSTLSVSGCGSPHPEAMAVLGDEINRIYAAASVQPFIQGCGQYSQRNEPRRGVLRARPPCTCEAWRWMTGVACPTIQLADPALVRFASEPDQHR